MQLQELVSGKKLILSQASKIFVFKQKKIFFYNLDLFGEDVWLGFFLKFNLNLFLYKLNSLIKSNIKKPIKTIFPSPKNNVGRASIHAKILVNLYIFRKFAKIINDHMDLYLIITYKSQIIISVVVQGFKFILKIRTHASGGFGFHSFHTNAITRVVKLIVNIA